MRLILFITLISLCFSDDDIFHIEYSEGVTTETTQQPEQVSEETELYSGRLDLAAVDWCTGPDDFSSDCCALQSRKYVVPSESGLTEHHYWGQDDGSGTCDGHIPFNISNTSFGVSAFCCVHNNPPGGIPTIAWDEDSPTGFAGFYINTTGWDTALCDPFENGGTGLSTIRWRNNTESNEPPYYEDDDPPALFEGCNCTDINPTTYCGGTIKSWENNLATDDVWNTCQIGDECGVCGGSGIPENECDCDGTKIDECGVCGGDGIIEPFCDCDGNTLDCNGICGGDNLHCVGCIYETACNYDSLATIDNGTCEFAEYGYDCNGNELSITDSQLPYSYNINSIYPNPFNPITTISFSIPQSGLVSLKVYNISGKLSTTLKDEYMNVGYYDIIWDASNYPSGIYFVKMVSDGFIQTEKVVLVK
ncbi:MAG: T9SS type A sorting domain-containing protein [Candidatus Marinimicrobia bacterium]|nr:T9SS type A sorting domain-containing protein [Candidatus Neomarinimicrobiota bacterium]